MPGAEEDQRQKIKVTRQKLKTGCWVLGAGSRERGKRESSLIKIPSLESLPRKAVGLGWVKQI
jgi:hypothetical protein